MDTILASDFTTPALSRASPTALTSLSRSGGTLGSCRFLCDTLLGRRILNVTTSLTGSSEVSHPASSMACSAASMTAILHSLSLLPPCSRTNVFPVLSDTPGILDPWGVGVPSTLKLISLTLHYMTRTHFLGAILGNASSLRRPMISTSLPSAQRTKDLISRASCCGVSQRR